MALVESFSGIRGIYDKDLTDAIAVRYAYSYYSFLKSKTKKSSITIVIGMDTRASGIKLADSIMGILDCNFIDIGIAPTPAVEFAVRHFNADGGIIITASHNEPYWNGFKFLNSDGSILGENDMNIVIGNSKAFRDFHKIQEKKILEQAGVEVVGVSMNYGEFNRTVEPTEDSLIYLKNIIDENKADFAAGFDCDADRIEILMGSGQLLSGNYILAMVVDEILSNSKNPRNKFVVVNDVTSNAVRDVVQKHGAKLKEVEVGETNVVQEMSKLKAIVGGEGSSGGVIMPPSKCRDGILTLLAILSIIAKKEKKLEDIIEEFPGYCNLKKKMEFDATKHDKIKKYLKDYYSKKGLEIKETGGIKGGLKIITGKSSFVWFRASRTEGNVFRVVSESDDKKEAEKLMEEAVDVFEKANE